MHTSSKIKGIFYALLSSSSFGFIPLFSIPLLLQGMHTPSILFFRFGLATLVVGILSLARNDSFRISLREAALVLLLAMLYGATSMGLLLSYQYIPSGVATTIHFLYPIVVATVMGVVYKERQSTLLFIAAPLSLVGVGMLSWGGQGGIHLGGIALVLVTVLTYGLYIVAVSRSSVARLSSSVLTFYVMLGAMVVFGAYAVLTTGIETAPNLMAWGSIGMLVLIPTIISNLCLVLAVKHAGSTTTALMGSMEPVTAVLIGLFYFSEPFGWQQCLGLALVIMAVSMVVWQQTRKAV